MKKDYIFFMILGLFLTTVLFNAGAQVTTPSDPNDYVKGKIRVKLKKEYLREVNGVLPVDQSGGRTTGIVKIDELNEQIGVKRMKRVFPFSIKHEARHRAYNLHLWYELEFDESLDPKSISEKYSVLEEVEIAKPLYKKILLDDDKQPIIVQIDTSRTIGNRIGSNTGLASGARTTDNDFDDPLLPDQWHYENDGTVGTKGVDIDLFNAWTKATGSRDIIVAIVDGGIDTDHEDLMDNLWVNDAEMNGEPGIDDDGNGYVDDFYGFNFVYNGPLTDHNHGTHVAGTVGAVTNNGIGVAGVAGGNGSGNGVRLMSCQVYDNRGGSGNFAAAIVYGADNGAVISQNSWGYNQPGYYEPEVLDAIRYFIAEAGQYEGSPMKGGILFFAAGNNGNEIIHYPGAFDEVIGVAATGPTGYPAPYSNYGDWVDIAAPGGDQAYYNEEGGVLSTLPGNKYGYYQGTSMATPHVSGVAALVIARFGGNGFRAEELKKIILNSTTPFIFEHQDKFGTGNLNATLALAENEYIPPDPIDDLTVLEVFHNEVRLQWTVPKDQDDFQPSFFILAISENPITAGNFDQQRLFQIKNYFEAGTTLTLNVSGLLKKTDYWFAVKSSDRFLNISDISNVVNVTTTDEPHFMESTRELEFVIDVRQDPTKTGQVTFSNIGEGIVYWNSFNVNENPFWIDFEEWKSDLDSLASLAYANPDMYAATKPATITLSTPNGRNTIPEYMKNDNTLFVSGYSYVQGNPTVAIGSNNLNSGLIFATRFQTTDGPFNLTHLELGLLSYHKEEPVFIEIRKGSDKLEDAKTIYVQKYFADTTGILNIARVPILEPQHFEQDEYFWIVLYFSKKEPSPLLGHMSYYYPGTFYMSNDNGLNFSEAWRFLDTVVPILTAYSTGDDPSYVFISPTQGEIAAGTSQDVEFTIDATELSNGRHLASTGIYTNDINKPGIAIEVKVTVTGQTAAIEKKDLYQFDVDYNKPNHLSFGIKNTGLADLIINDIKLAENGQSVKDFEDSLVAGVNKTLNIPFVFTPNTLGLLNTDFLLVTNIGEIGLSAEMASTEAPEITAILDTGIVEIPHNATAEINLTLTNTGSGSVLEYDLSQYNPLQMKNGAISDKFDYVIKTSDDTINPVTSKWIDISQIAKISYKQLPVWQINIDLAMNFPLYNMMLNDIRLLNSGQLYAFNLGPFDIVDEPSEIYRASGFIGPLVLSGLSMRITQMYYYPFGDKEVFYFDIKLRKAISSGVKELGNISYEIILYRDGTIEFHYIDVDALSNIDNLDYLIGIQGMVLGDYNFYREYGDSTKNVHSGMVIRFEPDRDVSFISIAEEITGTITKSASKKLRAIANPSLFDLGAGTYTNYIKVKSNAGTPAPPLPVTIKVTGNADFNAADTIKFKTAHIGFDDFEYLKIENTGPADGLITDIVFNHGDFSTPVSLPLKVAGTSHVLVPIYFAPSTDDNISTTLTVSFDNGQNETVALLAKGTPDPQYTLNIEQDIVRDINGGEIIKIPFTITNSNSGVPMNYSFTNSLFAKVETTGILNGEGVKWDTLSDYGYTWKISDSSRVFYKWKDIKENGIPLDIQYEEQYALKLPFSFPFYGALYDSVWISKNGYITVVKPESDEFRPEFTKDDGLRGMIAPFYSDLVPADKDSYVWLLVESDRIYVLWDGYRGVDPGGSGGSVFFQLELVDDGSIYFHYRDINKFTFMLNYGLESPDESETFEKERSWILKWSDLDDSTTVAIAAPLHDNINNAETKDFDLLLSAERIYQPGTYKDTIVLATNSLAQPMQEIPVTLNVTGGAILNVPDSIVWDEVIYQGVNTPMRQKIVLSNKGHDIAEITTIPDNNLDEFHIYDKNGVEYKKTTSGILFNPIKIEPWGEVIVELEVIANEQFDINGTITFSGNFPDITSVIMAKLVDTPVFAWDATDQEFDLNNAAKKVYSFTMENRGETSLDYRLIPAVIPSSQPGDTINPIVDEIGHYVFEKPTTVDSLYHETKDKADGYETPMIPVILAFSNEMIAPKGGFYLTHVKVNADIKALDEYIRIQVFKGGTKPMEGELMYQQDYIVDRYVSEEWVYFPLKYPLSFAEGEHFFVVVIPPPAQKYIGYDIAPNEDAVAYSWAANWQAFYDKWNWQQYKRLLRSYKIRALTAAGDGLWVELDNMNGKLAGGESVKVNASIDPVLAGKGTHKALIRATTNDVNHKIEEVKITINVNGAPEMLFRPNMYEDTIKVVETEELTVNYLFEDPEHEKMTITMDQDTSSLNVIFEQTGENSAQVTFRPGYDDEGGYTFSITLTDEAGNIVKDQIILKVLDKNRPPELNPDYSSITLNMAGDNGGVLVIDPNELFTDPDGDELMILAGNYTPEILDMALGNNIIDLHPLKTGTGFIVFGADDGKENGFVVYGIYVQVIDDESLAGTSTDGFSEAAEKLVEKGGRFAIYPNPVMNTKTNVIYKLEKDAEVIFDIYDVNGRRQISNNAGPRQVGIYTDELDVTGLRPGVYICRLIADGEVIETSRIIIQ